MRPYKGAWQRDIIVDVVERKWHWIGHIARKDPSHSRKQLLHFKSSGKRRGQPRETQLCITMQEFHEGTAKDFKNIENAQGHSHLRLNTPSGHYTIQSLSLCLMNELINTTLIMIYIVLPLKSVIQNQLHTQCFSEQNLSSFCAEPTLIAVFVTEVAILLKYSMLL